MSHHLEPDARDQFVADDGVEIAYAWFGRAESPDVPVILQHGFAADSAINWVAPGIVSAIVAAGRTVVTVDARGHGLSGKPHDRALYGHGRIARDVRALIDRLGVASVDVGGYSMGAHVMLHVLRDDSRIRRAAIAGIGVSSVRGEPNASFRGHAIADAFDAYIANPSVRIADRMARNFVHFASNSGGDLRALAAQLRGDNSPVGEVHTDALVLVIAGVDDELAQTAPALAETFGSATLIQTPGDHLTALIKPEFVQAFAAHFA